MSPTPFRFREPEVIERSLSTLYCHGCERFVGRLVRVAISRYRCDMCAHDPTKENEETCWTCDVVLTPETRVKLEVSPFHPDPDSETNLRCRFCADNYDGPSDL